MKEVNKIPKWKKALRVLVIAIIVYFVISVVLQTLVYSGKVHNSGYENSIATSDTSNEENFRTAFVDGCISEDNATINDESMRSYCGCVYDELRKDYSIKQIADIGNTKSDTEMVNIMKPQINRCVGHIQL